MAITKIVLLLLYFILCVTQAQSCSTNIYVSSSTGLDAPTSGAQGNPYATISYALTTADLCVNAVVFVASGQYSLGTLPHFDNISIVSESGPANTFLDGGSFTDNGGYSFDGFSVTGTEIFNSNIAFINCIFTYNETPLKYNNSIGLISNCQFLHNRGLGAVVVVYSTVQIENSIFTNNSYVLLDDSEGFSVYYDDSVQDSIVVCGGGAVGAAHSNVTILNSSFYSNYAEDDRSTLGSFLFGLYGGAVAFHQVPNVVLDGCHFEGSYINLKSFDNQGNKRFPQETEGDTIYIFAEETATIKNTVLEYGLSDTGDFTGANVGIHGIFKVTNIFIENTTVIHQTNTAFQFDKLNRVAMKDCTFDTLSSGYPPVGLDIMLYVDSFEMNNTHVRNVDGQFLENKHATLSMYGCSFQNTTQMGGTITTASMNSTIENCTFHSNHDGYSIYGLPATSILDGGTGHMIVKNCVFDSNTAGGIFSGSQQLYVEDSVFSAMITTTDYGTILLQLSELHITNCIFNGTGGETGGVIYGTADSTFGSEINIIISNSTFMNTKTTLSGAIYLVSPLTVFNLVIENSRFVNNDAGYSGGALYLENANLTVLNSYFEANSGNGNGGAIYYSATTDEGGNVGLIQNTTFVRNSAEGPNSQGGTFYFDLSNSGTANQFTFIDSSFTGSWAANGGAFFLASSDIFNAGNKRSVITLENCVVSDNYVNSDGGAVYSTQFTSLAITNSRISNCNSNQDGGAIYAENSYIQMENTVVSNCSAVFSGGAAVISANEIVFPMTKLNNVTFLSNTASLGSGGALAIQSVAGANISIENSQFVQNYALSGGGAIYSSKFSQPIISGSSFVENSALEGGGLYVEVQSQPTVINSNFIANDALSEGGAATFSGKSRPIFVGSNFIANTAGDGGAISSSAQANATFTICTFVDNVSEGKGGAVFSTTTVNLSPKFVSCTFERNFALYGGAYSAASSSAQFVDCNVRNNSAHLQGGGMHATGTSSPQFGSSTFSLNSSPTGGALYCDGSSSLILDKCNLFNNLATDKGGAISFVEKCVPSVTNSELKNNTADSGGAIFVHGNSFTINGNTFASNSAMNGGGVYINNGMSDTAQFDGNQFQYCTAIIAGGGFFWDLDTLNQKLAASPSLRAKTDSILLATQSAPRCTNCGFTTNSANYGANYATKPITQFISQLPTVLSVVDGEVGPFTVTVADFYNQTITIAHSNTDGDSSNLFRVSATVRNTTAVATLPLIAGVTEYVVDSASGNVTFPQLAISGQFNQTYTVVFTLSGSVLGTVKDIAVPISYRGCTFGQEAITTSQKFDTCKPCSKGSYNINGNGICLPCPDHAVCSGGNLVLADDDYWLYVHNGTGIADTYNCPDGYCKKGACTKHRSGLLCGVCEPGYQSSYSSCIECNEPYNSESLFGDIVLLWLFVVLLQYSSRLPKSQEFGDRYVISGLTKIILFFLQIVPLLSTPGEDLKRLFSFFNFQFFFAFAQQCAIRLDYYGNFLLSILMPSILFGILVVNFILQHILYAIISRTQKSKLAERLKVNRTTYVRTICAMVLFSYSQVTEAVFAFINCRDVGSERVIATSPDISCESDKYKSYLVLAYFLLFTYVTFLPVFLLIVLVKLYRQQKLRLPFFSENFGILFQCFKSKHFYWEIVILTRRLLFILIFVVAYASPDAKDLALFIFAFLMLILHVFINPYFSRIENLIETALLSLLVVLAGIQCSQANDTYSDPISVFSAVVTFLAIVPIGIGLYCLVMDVLVRFGFIQKRLLFPPNTPREAPNKVAVVESFEATTYEL